MRSVKFLVVAGAASILSSLAYAADMPAIMPPPPMGQPMPVPMQPQMAYAPAPIDDFGGWYLRGYVGFSNTNVDRLNNALDSTVNSSVQSLGFGTAGIFGFGAGYQFNHWFRADATVEYNGKADFFGTDHITYNGGIGNDSYNAHKYGWLVMANAYVDLGTWYCMTPFIGVGAGAAQVTISDFTDTGLANQGGVLKPSLAYGDKVTKTNFAWALHAGVDYKVNQNLTIEFAYRYLNMGDGMAGDLYTFDGTNNLNNPMTFKTLTSHDFMIGARWNLDMGPAYAPQPVYAPQPLVRKG